MAHGEAPSDRKAAVLSCEATLRRIGIEAGARVVICSRSALIASVTAEAAFCMGATFVVLDHRLPNQARTEVLRELAADVLVTDSTVVPDARAIPDGVAHLSLSSNVEPRLLPSGLRKSYRNVSAASSNTPPALMVYTSGSSGRRRAVVLSQANFDFVLAAIQRRLQYRDTDVIGTFLPLSFDYGLYQVFLAKKAGASLYFGDSALAGPDLPRQLEQGRVTVFPAVPSLILALLRMLRRSHHPLPHLRMITSTGDYLPPEWVSELRIHLPHVDVYPMYGLTECKRVSILLPEEFERKPESVGRPLDGTRVVAVGEDDLPLDAGATGQLVVTGPHVAEGYFNAPEETAERFKRWRATDEQALFTGDFGHVDSDGFIYLVGRRDSLIKHKGFRMSSLEVERVALGVPGVDRAVLLHDPELDRISLVVCGHRVSVDALRGKLETELESFKIPAEIDVVAELPTTPNGKLDRRALQNRPRSAGAC